MDFKLLPHRHTQVNSRRPFQNIHSTPKQHIHKVPRDKVGQSQSVEEKPLLHDGWNMKRDYCFRSALIAHVLWNDFIPSKSDLAQSPGHDDSPDTCGLEASFSWQLSLWRTKK